MKQNVLITVCGLQDYQDSDADCIELTTSGVMYQKGPVTYVTYTEADSAGLGNTKTTMKFEETRVSIIRFGDSTSHLLFEEGQKHVSYYDMGFASLSMGVSTHSLEKEIGPSSVRVKIRYSMEINNALAGENEIVITVRPTNS